MFKICVAYYLMLDPLFIHLIEIFWKNLFVSIETFRVLESSGSDKTDWGLCHDFFKTEHIVGSYYQDGAPEDLISTLKVPLFLSDWYQKSSFNLEKNI